MTVGFTSAIGSHVGMVRSNNQDSGYAGNRLFLVADGMGGHAGGDVASALTTRAIAKLDEFPQQRATNDTAELGEDPLAPHSSISTDPAEVAQRLADSLLQANRMLRATVGDRPELSGMGTTFCGFMTVGDQLALAHIGDSRLYLLRDGKMNQITKDHTFVQRLVDSGRITEEEAKTHPRRSVLMRVLGDVDSSPDIDTEVLDTRPGDLWLLCSDGLCGYVEEEDIEKILLRRPSLQGAVDNLIDKALSFGAPDNVTVVLVESQPGPASNTEAGTARFVGSAETETAEEPDSTNRIKIMGRRRSRRAQPVAESHFEPRVDEYLNELIAETKRRNRRRRLLWMFGLLGIITLILGGIALAYEWTQTRYFVGTDGTTVIIYQGVQQELGSLSLNSVAEETGIPLSSLDGMERRQIERTLSASSLDEAREIVARLGVDDS
ncbi:protein phosphatase 2C domain-containing protein [Leucobacter sp. UT-8R-CII-1-4]|uniref:PP2C family protein-serine/threonine phosphatase n=1 Tax=Leucobacter sp. UT-8R-CII-1-4 TaxID=3040075 RepID=UPI0024A8D5EF|nr:PP2C family serine/threonine-protein phosphatase [Leucobacter sp. UT-8R-CII-1-4]MDI6023434.1 protein phosphatase 2C domain-containing protein [Leucobacter sp. UT-8R-CII-1-4]